MHTVILKTNNNFGEWEHNSVNKIGGTEHIKIKNYGVKKYFYYDYFVN